MAKHRRPKNGRRSGARAPKSSFARKKRNQKLKPILAGILGLGTAGVLYFLKRKNSSSKPRPRGSTLGIRGLGPR